jgi:DHA2 family multidrug resistance protein
VLPNFLTWSWTDFMIALMLGFPISRTLVERYGSDRVFATAFILYAAASYLCFISQSFLLFLSGHLFVVLRAASPFLRGKKCC